MSEWTIYVCPRCGFMDPDQHDRSSDYPRVCPFASRGLKQGGVLLHPYSNDPAWNPDVEFVPIVVVPKERPCQPAGLLVLGGNLPDTAARQASGSADPGVGPAVG